MSEPPVRLVTLVVSGLDVEADGLLEGVYEAFGPDEVPLLSLSGDVPCATLSIDPAADLRAVVLDRVERLEAARPELRVLRVDDPLLAIAGLAHRAGVAASEAAEWVRSGVHGGPPFPLERGYVLLDSGPLRLWLWSEVTDWLRSSGHPGAAPEDLSAREVRMIDSDLALRREADARPSLLSPGPETTAEED